jgi:hypothetical protein
VQHHTLPLLPNLDLISYLANYPTVFTGVTVQRR